MPAGHRAQRRADQRWHPGQRGRRPGGGRARSALRHRRGPAAHPRQPGPARRAAPGARVRTEVLSSRPAWPERAANPLLRHVRSLAAVLGQQLDGGPAGGAGDTNLPGSRGLPTLDGFGAVGAGAHARHEHIRIDQLAPRIALLAALLAVPLPRLRDRAEG
ncbi:M20/M25/M40 family metallo-hydrolase [Kitasatospora aburaviensis]